MKTVLIDAGVLAAPRLDDEPSRVHEYVKTLLHWKILLNEPWVSVRLSEEFFEVLGDAIPSWGTLKDVFNKHQVNEYATVHDVITIFYRFLDIIPHFETDVKISKITYDEFISNSTLSSLRMGSALDSDLKDLERCVILISILRKYCDIDKDIRIFVRSAPISGKIKIQTSIRKIDHERDDMTDIPHHPDIFEGDVIICDRFSDILRLTDETKIWNPMSDSIADFESALRLAIFKHRLARGIESDWSAELPVVVGSNFIETVKKSCENSWKSIASKMFRCISEVVDNLNMADTHWHEEYKDGPQRIRESDGAKGWRRDVDENYRLHYWKKGGHFELDTMGHHNDHLSRKK